MKRQGKKRKRKKEGEKEGEEIELQQQTIWNEYKQHWNGSSDLQCQHNNEDENENEIQTYYELIF